MRALAIERFKGPFVWKELPAPRPEKDQVLVRVRANGLCGTDLKILDGQVPTVPLPAVIGHELSGEVTEIGPGVEGLSRGDHVVVHIYVGCQACSHCRSGLENQCVRLRRLGFELPGGFAECVVAPARNVFRVSPTVPLEEVAILSGSVATVLHGLRAKAGIGLGDVVLVVGIGGLGIHAVQLSKALGARVIAVDISADRLAGAAAAGAAEVIDGGREDVAVRVRELTGGLGADVAVEIVGGGAVPGVLQQCLSALGSGGRLLVMGYGYGQPLTVDTADLVNGQWRLLGTRASAKQDLADVVTLVESGIVRPVVARTFPMESAAAAFDSLRSDPPLGRIVLVW